MVIDNFLERTDVLLFEHVIAEDILFGINEWCSAESLFKKRSKETRAVASVTEALEKNFDFG